MKNIDVTGQSKATIPEVVVYFDGSCPMCSKEIQYYRGLDKESRILWEDVAGENPSCPIGYDQATLMQRFHVKEVASVGISGHRDRSFQIIVTGDFIKA